MDRNAAKKFIIQNARPIDLAVYQYFFENQSNIKVIEELIKFQNEDGGFGHALEPDCFDPHSSPIATNDAIITLFRVNALEQHLEIVHDIVRYLKSHDSFDEEKKRWLFAIDSHKDYPHALWWEKTDDGIHGFNPTMSLASFMVCYGERTSLYEDIIKEGFKYLEEHDDVSGDALKCYLLSYELLKNNQIIDILDLNDFKQLISQRISDAICKDVEKYGIEYVAMPSDFFAGSYIEFITPQIKKLIEAEINVLGKLQKEDGGFDISWQWGTPYIEFKQARQWWRPRLTINQLLFDETVHQL